MKSSKNHIFEEFEDLENEWENEHPDTNFDMAKNEFKLLY